MKTSKTLCGTVLAKIGMAALAASVAWAATADGDAPRRPMVLMVMFDGMRADAVEAADMPNIAKLRSGTWQAGYRCAWSLTGQTEPVAAPNSAPNHVSIATGVLAAKHGVSANGQTANGNYAQYPTWLKRVVDAKAGAKAQFVYSWGEDAGLGPADGVTFLNNGDAGNATALAELLASENAPDATLYFIDMPDAGGHGSGFYPHSAAYLEALSTSDGYLGGCLDAISSRPTFDEEDWLILVTSDHGGYAKAHGQTTGRQAHTVPVILVGRDITPGRLPGLPYNFDITASALAHFGIDPVAAGLDAALRDHAAVTDIARRLSDGLSVYMPFNESATANAVQDSEVVPTVDGSPAITGNGFVDKYLNIPSGSYVRLGGTEALTFEGGDKSFTAMVWVKMGAQTGDSAIFGNEDWSRGTNKGVLLCAARKQDSSTAGVVLNVGSGSDRQFNGTFDYEASDRWTLYVVTRSDEGVITTYQGRSDGTLNWASAPFDAFVLKSGYPFCIGQDGTGNYGKKFVGGVDDFALWTRSLTHEEIRSIYSHGRSGMCLGDMLTIDANDAPTLSVTANDGETVSLAFGGRRTRNLHLCVASGAADGEGDKHAWTQFETVAEIAPETATYDYAIPQAFKDSGAKFRFFLLQTDSLPYAREVAYAHSQGGSHIDTGIAPRRDLTATFDLLLTEANGTWDWMFGAMGTGDKKSNFGLARLTSNGFWHMEVSGNNDRPFECTLNERHHATFSPVLFTADDNRHASGLVATSFIESGWTINLYRNLKMGAAYDQTMKGRYYSFKLATPLCTVREFVPAVAEDDTVGLFDAVTGRFYASAGDALTAGEDCEAARYGWVRATSETLSAGSNVPLTALWTGAGDNAADLADPGNWVCRNLVGDVLDGAVPTEDTAATVAGEAAFAVPAGTSFVCKSLTFDGVLLTADVDLRGLDLSLVTGGSTIDLQGRNLIFAKIDTAAFTITDTSTDAEHPGVLHVEIGAGIDCVNQNLQIDGNLRLVKEGEGVLTAMKAGQTYSGGTRVAAGGVKFGVTSVNMPFGAKGTTIEVAAGAYADAWSRNINEYAYRLEGGKLINTRNIAVGDMISSVGNITLSADSEMPFDTQNSVSADKIIANGSVWDLGGHTLTIVFQGKDPDLWFSSNGNRTGAAKLILKNGTVKTQGNGWFHDLNTDGIEGGSYDFASILRHYGTSTVSNLTIRTTSNVVGGDGVYRVYGTFTPLSPYCNNVLMLDGSTIDLSSKTGAWSATFVNSDNTRNTTFDEGACVTIDLHGRSDLAELAKSDNPYVITWSAAPDPTVKLVPDNETASASFYIVPDETGAKLVRRQGTQIIVR